MQAETKTVLQTTDIAAHLKAPTKPLTDIELQQDYDYFMAQETANMLLSAGLISLVEFNKLTQINRDTFSPMLAEIMPKIT
ncbi:MAG: SHOCT domain-containing protein [Christensenella sp.]|uniref:SHOCT domain-containing protein n=1 Tax=Christensenella sp. TaxID=1935934 RepID=UPI002B1F6ED7|nr:SHOCT domain-containing protein [Christensenella sp.]MEA5003262.1 SHOCT domain-containing protein [Christensenella sp.]